jgi:ABC-type sugar transport system ATPase subunit
MTETFAARGVIHAYGTDVVLHEVGFTIPRHQVAALVGENGSGKSTLLKVMTGAVAPIKGRLELDGEEVSFARPADAQRAGVAVVYQDYNLVSDLSVAENIFSLAHRLPRRGPLRRVDRPAIHARVSALLDELGIPIGPGRLVRTLDAVERKFVEIARAMVVSPRYLILDEPTASLEPAAAERVLGLVDQLRSQGTGIALVSHRLDEIIQVSDQITVLRDGRRITTRPATEVSGRELAHLVGGVDADEAGQLSPPAKATHKRGDVRLRLRDADLAGRVRLLELDVHAGEIVGLTGLLGSGAADVVAMLGGTGGDAVRVQLDGETVRLASPADARRARIGYIPEDRKGQGLILSQSVAANISLASLDRTARGPLLNRRAIDRQAREYARDLSIRASSIHAPVASLSGGNQQKVLIARWLAAGVRLLAIDEPTHGVDVGGKAQIHGFLRRFVDDGGAVLIASTDLHEILDLCDRVGVMRHGALAYLGPADGLSHVDLTMLGAAEAA